MNEEGPGVLPGPFFISGAEYFASSKRRVGEWCDVAFGENRLELFGSIAPTAGVAIGEFEKECALVAGNDRTKRRTLWEFDMRSRRAPSIAEPSATFNDPYEVMAEMSMTTNDHSRGIVDVGAPEVGLCDRPLLAYDRD